jgi:TolB-like protein
VSDQADMSFYRRVAVLPFSNLSPDRFAGERVTRAFITELIIAHPFEVIEPSEFAASLEKVGGEPNVEGRYDPDKLKDAAAKAEANGIIRGAVTEYSTQRAGGDDFPAVSFDVELLDAATQRVVWRISINRRGHGRVPVFGGPSERTFGRLTQDACADAVAHLRAKAF